MKREEIEAASQRAIARQPDEIHLIPAPDHEWSNRSAVETYVRPLLSLGFTDVGSFTVDVLTVAAQFLLKEPDNVYAVVYEHPKAGVWLNLVILYENGESMTLTSTADRGLEKRPGHPTLHAPGSSAEKLYAITRELLNQPQRKTLAASMIVEEFERAWAEGVKWRKDRGVSATEAVSVLLSRDGKKARMLRPNRIEFVAEQIGGPENELKKRLSEAFGGRAVGSAYLARVRYDESPDFPVALCLRDASPNDEVLLSAIQRIVASVFQSSVQLDIIFITAADVSRIEAVCAAFYRREVRPETGRIS